jgi:hypothetical protein
LTENDGVATGGGSGCFRRQAATLAAHMPAAARQAIRRTRVFVIGNLTSCRLNPSGINIITGLLPCT